MNTVQLVYSLLLGGSILSAIFLVIYAAKRRSMPGAKYFMLLMLSIIFYNTAYIGEINSAEFSSALFWFTLEYLAIPLKPYFWVMMSLEYAQIPRRYLKVAKYGLLYHPILFYSIFFTNDYHHLYISSYEFISNGYFLVLTSTKGILYFLVISSSLVCFFLAATSYIRASINSACLYRKGYLILFLASLLPWFSGYLDSFQFSYLGIDYFPLTAILSGIIFMYVIFSYRIFSLIPLANDMIFRQAQEGILLVDSSDIIVDANETFLQLYPDLRKSLSKDTLTSFLGRHTEFQDILGGSAKLRFTYQGSDGERYYFAEISKILLESDREVGKIFKVTNITPFVEHEINLNSIVTAAIDKAETHEISFLQAQISPHFINNTLSVIASMITRAPDEAKLLITNLGEYLANRYYFDSESATVSLEDEIETVYTYISIEKARFRDRLNFQLLCDNVPQIDLPRLVLQPLVENAVRHGILKKASGGNVWLKIYRRENLIHFEIGDDGVGLAEERIREITAYTDNNNKQSIGIRNINKRLQKYYGKEIIINSQPGVGTVVSFVIPDRNQRDS